MVALTARKKLTVIFSKSEQNYILNNFHFIIHTHQHILLGYLLMTLNNKIPLRESKFIN